MQNSSSRTIEKQLDGKTYQLVAGVWTSGANLVTGASADELDKAFFRENYPTLGDDDVDNLINKAEDAGRFVFAQNLLERAIRDSATRGDGARAARRLATLVALKRHQDDPKLAILAFDRWCRELPQSITESKHMEAAYVCVGAAYVDVKDYERAEEYLAKAEELAGCENDYIRNVRDRLEREGW